jgi:hypothetical protein
LFFGSRRPFPFPPIPYLTYLWSDLPDSDARRNLRGDLLKLRQFIEPLPGYFQPEPAFHARSRPLAGRHGIFVTLAAPANATLQRVWPRLLPFIAASF